MNTSFTSSSAGKSRGRPGWFLWGVIAIVVILGLAASWRLVLAMTGGKVRSPGNKGPVSPAIRVAELELQLERVRVKRLQIDRGIKSVPDALYLLVGPKPSRPGSEDVEKKAALSYLLATEASTEHRRAVVEAMFHPSLAVDDKMLQLLAQYGQPSDGQRLWRKSPRPEYHELWLDLLKTWDSEPPPGVIGSILANDAKGDFARLLISREMGKTAILDAVAAGRVHQGAMPSLKSAVNPGDLAALEVMRTLERGRETFITKETAAQLVKTAPCEEVARRLRDVLIAAIQKRSDLLHLESWLPALTVLDDPPLWEAARLRAISGVRRLASRRTRRSKIATPLSQPDLRRLIARLVWDLERDPNTGKAMILATLIQTADIETPWPLKTAFKRRPEIARLAPLKSFAQVESTSDGANKKASPPSGEEIAQWNQIINDALADLASGDWPKANQAADRLTKVDVLPERRAEVLQALQPYLRRRGAPAIAFCRWADASQQSTLVQLATSRFAEPTGAEALKTLLAQKSPLLPEVARRHMGRGAGKEVLNVWYSSGALGEKVICEAIISLGPSAASRSFALGCLERIGGRRSVLLLNALLDADFRSSKFSSRREWETSSPRLKRLREVARRIEERLATNESKGESP